MRALIIFFLFVLILTPGLLLGILESPWFFLILFALLLLFPIVLAPRVNSSGSSGSTSTGSGEESMGPLVWILVGAALFFALPVLIIGFLLIPGFFLLILLVMGPLIYLMFRS